MTDEMRDDARLDRTEVAVAVHTRNAVLSGIVGSLAQREEAVQRFERHNDEVRQTVPSDRLLVHNVEEGWAPLCAFLGVPQPATKFPNMNDRAAIKKTIGDVIKGMYVVLAGYAVAAAVVIYGLYRLLL